MPFTFSQTILNGANRFHTAPAPLRHRPLCPTRLAIGTLNIRDVKGFGLVQATRSVERGGLDVMLLTEAKIHTELYSHNHLGYNVTCSKAHSYSNGVAWGGVGLVTREWPDGWGIESTRFHGPNVVSCEIVTGPTQTPLVGAYFPPSTLEHLPYIK